MSQTATLQDLFNPGAAENFFSPASFIPFDPLRTRAFSRRNALWLAEFSRLIYRQEADEIQLPAPRVTRADILLAQTDGWKETDFFRKRDSQAAFFVNAKLGAACLVFRGTLGLTDLASDAHFVAGRWQGKGHVHQGFKLALDSVWEPIEAALRRIQEPVFFTGHSLGGALATLAAARTLHNPELNSPAAVYSFGSPRVGDAVFRDIFRDLFHCRLVNDHDIVTTVPPAFSLPFFPVFQHTGEMHRLLPGGVMEVFPNGFDVRLTRNPAAGIMDFTNNLGRLITGIEVDGPPPPSLIDHAPLNYVTRLREVAANEP